MEKWLGYDAENLNFEGFDAVVVFPQKADENRNFAELLAYRQMPLDKIGDLVNEKIPVVLVAGDSDKTVPYTENGIFLERAYKEANLPIEVYIKKGCDHHPHGLAEPSPVVKFILKNQK